MGNGYRYSFARVNERTNQFGRLLQTHGVNSGDRVAVLGKNDEWITTCLFGAAKIGAVTVLLNWRLQAQELAYILYDCSAAVKTFIPLRSKPFS